MEYLEFAIGLAREAGEVLKHYASREKNIRLKGRANLVTIADKESEDLVIRRIQQRYPGHAVLAEESGESASKGNPSEGKWIIDPLDGTTNFAHQYPFYCVSIAFERDGEIQCGAVYDPYRDEMFSASKNGGAFDNGERLRVSEVEQLAGGLVTTGFPYTFPQKVDKAMGQFREVMLQSQAVRRGGSAALDLCYVAMGRCDGFWEMDLHPWDTAAGRVIAEEAGARITDFKGNPFSIYSREILASNGRIHAEMVEILSRW